MLSLNGSKTLAEVRQGFTYFRDGDVLVAKITPCFENGKGALAQGLTNRVGFGTTELHVLRPGPEIEGRYLELVTRLHVFREQGASEMTGSAGQQRVPEAFVRNYLVPLPPPEEQRAIAAFLDRETARIDALIAHKERLIALLEEKRQAVISHAVTRGLDPSIRLKDSGIERIGAFPATWDLLPLGRLLMLQRGFDLPDTLREEGPYPIVSSGGVTGFHRIPQVRPPGIVTGRYGTIGEVYYIEAEFWPLNTTLYVKDFKSNHPKYLSYLLKTIPYQSDSDKSAVPGVNRNLLHRIPVVRPPVAEQAAIANYLDRFGAVTDSVVARVRHGITHLQEYRTALISAAVTGQIDVRDEVTV